MNLNQTNFDMILLTAEVFEMLEERASGKKIQLKLGEKYDKNIIVYADREKVRQVLTNLIDNSIKYGKEGGYTRVSFFDLDEHILTEVTDNGMGVEQEDIPRLFERFYRTDKARSRDRGGSGLGLSIVKHIIEAHGQDIHVRSLTGVGTTFGFSLQKSVQKHFL